MGVCIISPIYMEMLALVSKVFKITTDSTVFIGFSISHMHNYHNSDTKCAAVD